MSIEETFIEAAKNRRMVELVDTAGRARIVEPYMIYISSTGERLFHCYQFGGFSKTPFAEPAGWRNPRIADFVEAHDLLAAFRLRRDYNPEDRKHFPAVIFALPKPDDQASSL